MRKWLLLFLPAPQLGCSEGSRSVPVSVFPTYWLPHIVLQQVAEICGRYCNWKFSDQEVLVDDLSHLASKSAKHGLTMSVKCAIYPFFSKHTSPSLPVKLYPVSFIPNILVYISILICSYWHYFYKNRFYSYVPFYERAEISFMGHRSCLCYPYYSIFLPHHIFFFGPLNEDFTSTKKCILPLSSLSGVIHSYIYKVLISQ